MPQRNHTDLGVGFTAKTGIVSTKSLAVGVQLYVYFEADYGFVCHDVWILIGREDKLILICVEFLPCFSQNNKALMRMVVIKAKEATKT
jgi:hypothetical protein